MSDDEAKGLRSLVSDLRRKADRLGCDEWRAPELCKRAADGLDTLLDDNARLRAALAWKLMDTAPTDRVIIAMCRYPTATAGSPSFVVWDGEFGWEYSRNKPEKMVCWAWMERDVLGHWPSEALSHHTERKPNDPS